MSKDYSMSIDKQFYIFLNKHGIPLTCICMLLLPFIVFFPNRLREDRFRISDLMSLMAFVGIFSALTPYLIALDAGDDVTRALCGAIGFGIGCLCAILAREPIWIPSAAHCGMLWKILVIDVILAISQ